MTIGPPTPRRSSARTCSAEWPTCAPGSTARDAGPAPHRTVRPGPPRRARMDARRPRAPVPPQERDSLARGPGEPPVTLPRPPGRASFWLGAILVLLSFAIYPAYPLLPFLPISLWQKGGAGIALAALSWTMFFAGSALVGKKGL